ncbi:hypothetical protein LCGC14_2538300 [marine sediment metagenome]|uniref:Uncharacterized protein n=1 Tax=marine sediment metagenome TaxID=412755 RepID=A0A0F9D311_9ZZZZ|nr:hypothetical protein [Phycisphaerales bacterium]
MADLAEFTEQDWQGLLDRLTVHAQRKYVKLGWFSNGKYRNPQGHGPEDVAAEAITRTIEGRRTYDEKKCPDFYYFLKRCVDSIISHLIDSKETEITESMPSIVTDKGAVKEIELEGCEASPLIICTKKDLAEKVEFILRKAFEQDEIVCGILDCLDAGIDKRSEMAEYLEVSLKEIDNAKKRLRREVDKKLNKLSWSTNDER